MKITLTLELRHRVEQEDVPLKIFGKSSELTLELPEEHDGFLRAFDDLAQESLPKMAHKLHERVITMAQRYIEEEKKRQVKQLQFEFMQDQARVSATAPA